MKKILKFASNSVVNIQNFWIFSCVLISNKKEKTHNNNIFDDEIEQSILIIFNNINKQYPWVIV